MRIHEVIRFNDLSEGKKESIRKAVTEMKQNDGEWLHSLRIEATSDYDFGDANLDDIISGEVQHILDRAWCEMEFDL